MMPVHTAPDLSRDPPSGTGCTNCVQRPLSNPHVFLEEHMGSTVPAATDAKSHVRHGCRGGIPAAEACLVTLEDWS